VKGPLKKAGHFKNRNGTAQRWICARRGKYCSESQALEGVRTEHSKVVQIVTLLCEGLFYGHTVATRNKRHFEPAGVQMLDPLA